MRHLLYFSIIVLISNNAFSQDFYGSPEFNKFWQNLDHLRMINETEAKTYKGSPYLFENDQSAVTLKNGQTIDKLTLRYNVYNDEMEIKKGEQYYTIPKEKLFPKIKLGDHAFELRIYKVLSKKQLGYFEVLVSDSVCSLFVRHNVFLSQAQEPKPYQEAKPAEFKSKMPDTYIAVNGEVLMQVKGKNEFLELMPDHTKALTAFIKTNKIKFKKPESVKKLVEYYNSL